MLDLSHASKIWREIFIWKYQRNCFQNHAPCFKDLDQASSKVIVWSRNWEGKDTEYAGEEGKKRGPLGCLAKLQESLHDSEEANIFAFDIPFSEPKGSWMNGNLKYVTFRWRDCLYTF